MNPTRASLLSRVKNASDEAAWREFDHLYHDLLVRFCRRRGLQEADAADVVQIVMTSLVKSLPGFAYDPKRGRFRDYLYRCTDHAVSGWASGRAGGRPKQAAAALEEGDAQAPRSESWAVWEDEWIAHHYRLAMGTIRQTFEARSVEVFDRSVSGQSVAELAAAYGMSEQAVHKVRQRIKARMEELIALQVAQEDDAGDGRSR